MTITEEEKQRRINTYYRPYRDLYADLLKTIKPKLVVSVHSFTDNYEGNKRDVEVGLLLRDECKKSINIGRKILREFKKLGYDSRENEPWTGDIMDVVHQALEIFQE
jgi:predicted N-formylglutamate amidohydrolase